MSWPGEDPAMGVGYARGIIGRVNRSARLDPGSSGCAIERDVLEAQDVQRPQLQEVMIPRRRH